MTPPTRCPIHEFPHSGGLCSVTGGYVYRGGTIPSLYGHYLYGDWCTGRIWSFRYDGSTVQDLEERTNELGGPFGNLVSFGEDAAGELYFMNSAEDLYRIDADCSATVYCDEAQNPNNAADISIDTCALASGSSVRLTNGPAGQFCYLLIGGGTDSVSQPPGSKGDLCVVGGGCIGAVFEGHRLDRRERRVLDRHLPVPLGRPGLRDPDLRWQHPGG